jgi:hypothetical protein
MGETDMKYVQEKMSLSPMACKQIKRVLIGDPCYVISEDLWDKDEEDDVCSQLFEGKHKIRFSMDQIIASELSLSLHQDIKKLYDSDLSFLICETNQGDGEYKGILTDFPYGVDSGTLGIIPDYLVDFKKFEQDGVCPAQWFTVPESSEIYFNMDVSSGNFSFYLNGKLIESIST